jgi:hypothetical protein
MALAPCQTLLLGLNRRFTWSLLSVVFLYWLAWSGAAKEFFGLSLCLANLGERTPVLIHQGFLMHCTFELVTYL